MHTNKSVVNQMLFDLSTQILVGNLSGGYPQVIIGRMVVTHTLAQMVEPIYRGTPRRPTRPMMYRSD